MLRDVDKGRHDFDFIFGSWHIRNRKLADVTDPGCDEWVEFDATSRAEPILGGLGHVDRMFADEFEGYTLRQVDPVTGTWRIWWASTRNPGHLDPPVEGSWTDGRGTFLCEDVIRDAKVTVRFEWTHAADGATACWEQSFSYDDGATWRVNWTMNLTRTA
jgi:hypothetical protein